MLDFDEEIQKFQPSLEVEDAEDAIYKNDVPDITDLINKIIEGDVTNVAVSFQQMTHVPSVVQMSLYTKRLPGFQIYITTKVLRKPV